MAHTRTLARRFGARAWSACLEEYENARDAGTSSTVYHTHAYFFWTDGVGLQLGNLDPLLFEGRDAFLSGAVDICWDTMALTGVPGRKSILCVSTMEFPWRAQIMHDRLCTVFLSVALRWRTKRVVCGEYWFLFQKAVDNFCFFTRCSGSTHVLCS